MIEQNPTCGRRKGPQVGSHQVTQSTALGSGRSPIALSLCSKKPLIPFVPNMCNSHACSSIGTGSVNLKPFEGLRFTDPERSFLVQDFGFLHSAALT